MNEPWFGGYVNVTAYPVYEFDVEASDQSHVVLGFIVADPEESCTPSWGGYHDLDSAGARLHLDRQVIAQREGGGEVAVSFGGAARDELSTVCTDPGRLYEAYRTVVDRYDLDIVDLDVEMNDLEHTEAHQRRAEALARLQAERDADDPLAVWLTLPVGIQGMDAESRDVVQQTLETGVELAGVNLMTMNYSTGKPADQSVLEASTTAARAAHGQLKDIYAQADQPLTDDLVWNRIGLTPMIGQNDIRGEVLGLDEAARLNAFAREQGVGRMSFWSLNRDRSCAGEDVEPGEASGLCSGVAQKPDDYTAALGEGYPDTE